MPEEESEVLTEEIETDKAETKSVNADDYIASKSKRKKSIAPIAITAVAIAACVIGFVLYCPHENVQSATCTEPEICLDCEKEFGEPLGHDWKEATCTEPKTCVVCEETEGEALGHNEGEWKRVKEPSPNSLGERQKTCSTCGEVVKAQDIFYYEFTPEKTRYYQSVLDTYYTLELSGANPESFEILGAVVNSAGDRTTIHLAYTTPSGERTSDYFWKDVYGDTVKNRFGIDNYEGRHSGTPQKLDLDEIAYYKKFSGYTPEDCEFYYY